MAVVAPVNGPDGDCHRTKGGVTAKQAMVALLRTAPLGRSVESASVSLIGHSLVGSIWRPWTWRLVTVWAGWLSLSEHPETKPPPPRKPDPPQIVLVRDGALVGHPPDSPPGD